MWLKNIPMTQTVNKMYCSNFRTGRRFKSKEAVEFETNFSKWVLTHGYQLGCIKNSIQMIEKNNLRIELQREFYFPKEKLFCKNGKPKRLDVTNRIKQIDDALMKEIGVDDCHIFYATERKEISDSAESYINIYCSVISCQ